MGLVRRSGGGGISKQAAWEAALERHEAAMRASGLPECPWVTEWERVDLPVRADALRRHFEGWQRHLEGCEVCRARGEYAEKHLPPIPPPPQPEGWRAALGRVLDTLLDALDRLPAWARPAAAGAGISGTVVPLGLLLAAVESGKTPNPSLLAQAAGVLVLAAGMGAAGGAAWSLVRKPFRRFGRAGSYLTGIAVVLAYLAPSVLAAPLLDEPFLGTAPGLVILLVVGVVFGLVLGRMIERDEGS